MSDQKKGGGLQSFQIGNLGGGLPGMGPRVPTGGSSTSPSNTTNSVSGIFPHLEALIEKSDEELRAFGDEMGEICQQLDDLISKRSGRVKEEAQRARQAYDRTFDMINHLIAVKAELVSQSTLK